MFKYAVIGFVFSFSVAQASKASASVEVLFKGLNQTLTKEKVTSLVNSNFDVNAYRKVRATVEDGRIVVFLFSNKFHRFDMASLELDQAGNAIALELNYVAKPFAGPAPAPVYACPDPATQFVSFAPNNNDLEQQVTLDVSNEAIARGLKTVQLLKDKATHDAYLNYLTCPNLVGNFYDGDSNPNEFITVDGSITNTEVSNALKGAFRYRVTNIWLACEAYNDPMKSAVLVDAQAQKYAAGINDLEIGPSDNAGACAMKAAIDGKPMTQAFNDCYKQFDKDTDIWGFGGDGSDLFGQPRTP